MIEYLTVWNNVRLWEFYQSVMSGMLQSKCFVIGWIS